MDNKKGLNVHISVMSGKLAGIVGINTNTVSNRYCEKMQKTDSICGQCYSERMLNTFRQSCVPAFQHNSELLSGKPLTIIPQINSLLCRFNSHGELVNMQHFKNVVAICSAEYNSGVTFALWTKRKNIVHQFVRQGGLIPNNLILIYSNPKVDQVRTKPPAYFDKIFNNVTKNSESINCARKCSECKKCYDVNNKTQCIVEYTKAAAKTQPKPNEFYVSANIKRVS